MMQARMILNGKKASETIVREAIETVRQEGFDLQVRVTYDRGDTTRMAIEACLEGVDRIIVGGGDGTINEAVNGIVSLPQAMRTPLGIVPLGTANDFARAATIPLSPLEALRLACNGTAYDVDAVRANDVGQTNERYFINVASGGFGAQIVADTPPALKNFLGGGAYKLSAVLKALSYTSHEGKMVMDDLEVEGKSIAAMVCNGRQAGGGQVLAPTAYIDDGLLDIVVILEFSLVDVGEVLAELLDHTRSGTYVKRFRKAWVESIPNGPRPLNLDGEPFEAGHIRFEAIPGALQLVLPQGCPLLKDSEAKEVR